MADNLEFGIDLRFDVGQVARAVTQISQTLDRIVDTNTNLGSSFRKAGEASSRAFNEMRDSARVGASAMGRVSAPVEELQRDMAALRERAEATRATLQRVGENPKLFSLLERELENLIRLERQFEQELRTGFRGGNTFEGLREQFVNIRTIVSKESAQLNELLRTGSRERILVAERENLRLRGTLDEQRDIRRRARGIEVSQIQTQGALALQEQRRQAALQLQQARRTSRTRLEILRFTLQQARVFERAIGRAFQISAGLIAGGLARIERVLIRTGAVFRRSNRDLVQGLDPALRTRERLVRTSFSRQTRTIRTETTRQERILQEFQARSSRGITGAVTGRSGLGALLGGGLAVGGGFALFQGVRRGFEVGGDFVQGLAVLQAQLQLTNTEIEAVRQQAINLGNDITLPGVSALDAAQAIQLLAKQFAALGDQALPAAQAAAKGVLQLSRASGASAEESAQVVGAAVNTFGVSADRAVQIADQVTNALTNAAGVGFSEFRQAFQQSAAVFSLFQVPALGAEGAVTELNAALAVLARGGLVGSDAGTSLKQFFLQANRGTDDANEKLQLLAERAGVVGSVFFDQSGNARALSDAIAILRRGLDGLSDQELTNTLQKIFGSDATRAAAILVRESAESYDALTEALGRTGSAAAIAEAQNVGLRGALDALDSVIETQQIKTYERYQAILGRVVIRFAELLDTFFSGEGRIELFRRALAGLTITLGGLLIVKGLSEAFGFLGLSLASIASPLGIFVAGAGALGAAFAVLLKVSPEFNEAVRDIGSILSEGFVPLIRSAVDLLTAFANILARTVAPIVVDFAQVLAATLRTGVTRFVNFIETTAVPALIRFGEAFASLAGAALRNAIAFIDRVASPIIARLVGFVRDTAIPALRAFADTIDDRVRPALDRLAAIGRAVRDEVMPLILPAIVAFDQLGDAIAAAFDGDFSQLGSGFAAIPGALVRSFANIGERLIDVLGPQLLRVVDFVVGQFSQDRLFRIVGAFGRVARDIGRVLGGIVSDPVFIQALEGIVGSAVFVAARFVQGFGEGVVANLPDLARLLAAQLRQALELAFRTALDPELAAALIVGAFAALTVGRALRQALFPPVREAGTSAARRFTTAFGTEARRGFNRNEFVSGVFGGLAAFDRAAERRGERSAASFFRGQNRAAETLRTLGRDPFGLGPGAQPFTLDSSSFRLPTEALDDLIQKYGAARVAGAELRARTSLVARDIGQAFRGVGIAISGNVSDGFRIAGTAAASFTRNLAGLVRSSIQNIRALGLGLGQALGGAIISGIGAALSGQALGRADSFGGQALGLAGVISSALFAGAAVGGGPLGVAIGGVTAGLGLVTAAISNSGKAAEEARERLDDYVRILEEVSDVSAALPDVADRLTQLLLEQDAEIRSLLVRSQVTATELAGIVTEGTVSAASAVERLGQAVGVDFSRLIDAAGVDASFSDILDTLSEVQAARDNLRREERDLGVTNRLETQRFRDQIDILEELEDQLQRVGLSADEARSFIAFLGDESTALEGAVDIDKFKLAFNPEPIDTFAVSAGEARVAFEKATGALDEIPAAAEEASLRVQLAFGAIESPLGQSALSLDDINEAIERLRDQRLGPIREQIQELQVELGNAEEAAKIARDSLFSYLNDDYTDSARQRVAQTASGIGSTLSTIISEVERQEFAPTAVALALEEQAAQFGESLKRIATTAFEDAGGEISIESLTAEFAPLRAVIQEELDAQLRDIQARVSVEEGDGGITQAEADRIKNQAATAAFLLQREIDEILDEQQLTAGLDFITERDQIVDNLRENLDALNVKLELPVTFSAAQIKAELEDKLGPLLSDPAIELLTAAQLAPRTSAIDEEGRVVAAQRGAVGRIIPSPPPPTGSGPQPSTTVFNNTFNIQSLEALPTAAEVNRELQTASAVGQYSSPRVTSSRVIATGSQPRIPTGVS